MHDGKAVPLGILIADAFSDSATYSIDDFDSAVQGIKANWAAMNEYGAVNTRCTVNGENTLRTMTLWKS